MSDQRPHPDDPIEALLSEALAEGDPGREDLRALLGELRAVAEEAPAPRPGGELAAFMASPLITDKGDLLATVGSSADGPADVQVAGLPKWRESFRRERARMLTGLSGFIGTLTGKVLLGGAVAAASVGGLHAGEVVDVPGLPDGNDDPPVTVSQQGDDEVEDQNGNGELPSQAQNGENGENGVNGENEGITAENLEEHPALYGLCQAWEANEDGREDGDAEEAEPFEILVEVAGSEEDVADLCEGVEPSNGQGQDGELPDEASTEGQENSEEGRDRAPDDPGTQGDEAGTQGDEAGTQGGDPGTQGGDPGTQGDEGSENDPTGGGEDVPPDEADDEAEAAGQDARP